MRVRYFILALLTATCFGQAWSGILNSNTAVDWTGVGIAGGIPSSSWSQCGSTISAYGTSGSPSSPSTINSAISSCASNHYVLLGSGDFYLNGGITLKSNVALRGAGANSTRLHFSADGGCNGETAAICMAGSNTYASGSTCGGSCGEAGWTAGYSQGTTTITLTSVSGITTNLTPIVLDQCETGLSGTTSSDTCTGSATDNNNIFVCDTSPTCITQSANTGIYRTNRAEEEVVVATNITGTGPYTVTITPAIRNPNWASAQGTRAWWPTATITNTGVEDLLIDQSTVGQRSVTALTCNTCWVEGIASTTANLYHVQNYITVHDVVRDSYFYWSYSSSQQSYGIGGDVSADLLIENNIFQGVTDPIAFDAGCPGCVAGYNFAVNQYFSPSIAYLFPMIQFHSAGTHMILSEGNIGAQVLLDDIHGTHDLDTFFRNYMNGFEPNNGTATSKNTSPFGLSAFSRYMNVVGNVVGTSGWHTTYWCAPQAVATTACSSGQFKDIYDIGWASNTLGQAQGSNNDPFTLGTTLLWGNVDSVTGHALFCGNSSDTSWSTNCGGKSASITSCTLSGTTGTCSSTLNPGVNYSIGSSVQNIVTITGNSVTGYNGAWPITASSGTSFSFTTYNTGMGTGTGGTATVGSSIPTADAYFPSSVPTLGDTVAGQSRMPSSFYNGVTGQYGSCGTGLGYWKNPTTGLCPQYPPVGPDVTSGDIGICTSGTYINSRVLTSGQCAGGSFTASTNGGFGNSNPAMRCYLNQMSGTPDGTGSMLTFNPAACYESDSAPAISLTPSTIPAYHSGNILVNLTGTLTSWTSGTTFSVGSPCTLVSQTVNAGAQTGTVTVTTSSSTGNCAVTDSTDSATINITVSTPRFSISPSAGAPGSGGCTSACQGTITFTGTNTVWANADQSSSGLFTVSGGTGASLGTITVTSNTSATATLTWGSSAATLTVTDTASSDGSTNTQSFTVQTITLPTVVTGTAGSPTTTAVTISSNTVTCTGTCSSVTAEGVACGATSSPTSSCGTATAGSSPFNVTLSGLTANTLYYFRAYATNSVGTAYGTASSFTTSNCTSPTVVGSYTFCNATSNALGGSHTTISTNATPVTGNGVFLIPFICGSTVNAALNCNSTPTSTVTISDNLNNPETCFIASPNSPFFSNDSTVPDIIRLWAFYCPSIPAGVTSFTATFGSTGYYPQLDVLEIKAGQVASSGYFESVDANDFGTSGDTATVTTSGPTVNHNDLILAMTQTCGGDVPQTVGTGYTGLLVNTPEQGHILEAQSVTATGTYSATSTWSSAAPTGCAGGAGGDNDSWFGIIIPLIGSGATPPPSPFPIIMAGRTTQGGGVTR